jgi:uncharacterized protein YciI
MKKTLFFAICAIFFLISGCEDPDLTADESQISDTDIIYDAELAGELGADNYGMRQYVIAFLKEGPNRSQDSTRAAELQRGHLDNIRWLAEEGKLVLAGPFMDSEEVRGLFVFNVRTVEEARELTETDPAIKAGWLAMELRPWYGSAALMEVNNIHSRISQTNP